MLGVFLDLIKTTGLAGGYFFKRKFKIKKSQYYVYVIFFIRYNNRKGDENSEKI